MDRWLPLLALVALLVSGCSGSSSPNADGGDPGNFDGLGLDATETTGLVRGVVVDPSIRPLEGATVRLRTTDGELTAETDVEGLFGFDGLAAGNYFLTAEKLNYEPVQTTVEVLAGDDDPKPVRMLLTPLFEQQPFYLTQKFEGFIQCGYQAATVTSLCFNDYETLLVPDIPPTLKEVFDTRGYVTSLDGNWSTLIFELTWEPSAQGTSPEMFVIVSFWNRTASDVYGSADGAPPSVLLRLESGVVGPGQQGCCDAIPPEGLPDLYAFAGIQGSPAAIGLSQDFTIFQSNFFHAKPPEGWSFVNGDKDPFQ